jgi:hypothetical protein
MSDIDREDVKPQAEAQGQVDGIPPDDGRIIAIRVGSPVLLTARKA